MGVAAGRIRAEDGSDHRPVRCHRGDVPPRRRVARRSTSGSPRGAARDRRCRGGGRRHPAGGRHLRVAGPDGRIAPSRRCARGWHASADDHSGARVGALRDARCAREHARGDHRAGAGAGGAQSRSRLRSRDGARHERRRSRRRLGIRSHEPVCGRDRAAVCGAAAAECGRAASGHARRGSRAVDRVDGVADVAR